MCLHFAPLVWKLLVPKDEHGSKRVSCHEFQDNVDQHVKDELGKLQFPGISSTLFFFFATGVRSCIKLVLDLCWQQVAFASESVRKRLFATGEWCRANWRRDCHDVTCILYDWVETLCLVKVGWGMLVQGRISIITELRGAVSSDVGAVMAGKIAVEKRSRSVLPRGAGDAEKCWREVLRMIAERCDWEFFSAFRVYARRRVRRNWRGSIRKHPPETPSGREVVMFSPQRAEDAERNRERRKEGKRNATKATREPKRR